MDTHPTNTIFIHMSHKPIKASSKSQRTFNPIRHIVDNLIPRHDHPLPLLNLALGDPTVHGNLRCPTVLSEAIQELLM
jgi:tyrosine aminotransferase